MNSREVPIQSNAGIWTSKKSAEFLFEAIDSGNSKKIQRTYYATIILQDYRTNTGQAKKAPGKNSQKP